MESIFSRPPNEDVRYRLAMYLFLQLYRLNPASLKRIYTRLEDSLVYLSNDSSPFVVEAFHLSLVVLREKDLISYKKCLKVLRPAVEQRSQEVCESLTLKLLELLAIHTKYHVQPSEAAIICPLFPRSATEYIHYLSTPLDSKHHQYRSSHPHAESPGVDIELDTEMGPRFFDERENRKRSDSKTKTNNGHKKQKSGCTVEMLDGKLDIYRNQGTRSSKNVPASRQGEKRSDSRDSSKSPQVIPRVLEKAPKKTRQAELEQKASFDQPTPVQRTPKTKRLFGGAKSEHGPLASPLMSPPEHSFLRSGDAWNAQDRRFETFGREEDEKVQEDQPRKVQKGFNSPPRGKLEDQAGFDFLADNKGHLNTELDKLVGYKDHLETYSQRARNRDHLANKTIVLIVEDLVLTGSRQELIRLHEYFLHTFHKEENQLEIISNILDECLYYMQFESPDFSKGLKILILTLNEYLRPPNLLTMLLVSSGDLLHDRHVLTHAFLRLMDEIILVTSEEHFVRDKHLLVEVFSVLQRVQSSWTKQVLLSLQDKYDRSTQADFQSVLSRFPQLEAIHQSAHPPPTERLYLLSTIPQLPELSMFKKVQLALSACKGTSPMEDGVISIYRNKKFRDASLFFMTCNRFHCDPFDGQGDWLHDLEDCKTLVEGRAMIQFLCAALRKRHFHLSRATCNDWLVTIAEFARQLLFDKASQQQAKEVLKLCILTMKLNGIGDYTYLLLPQEVTLLADF